jgi:hypothetical protein
MSQLAKPAFGCEAVAKSALTVHDVIWRKHVPPLRHTLVVVQQPRAVLAETATDWASAKVAWPYDSIGSTTAVSCCTKRALLPERPLLLEL